MNVPALHDHWYMPRAQPPHSPGQTKYEHHRVALTRAVRISNLKTAGMGTRENTQQHTSKQLVFCAPHTPNRCSQGFLRCLSPTLLRREGLSRLCGAWRQTRQTPRIHATQTHVGLCCV